MDEATHQEWAAGGERREWLELALLEVLREVGTSDAGPQAFKRVKVGVGFQLSWHVYTYDYMKVHMCVNLKMLRIP